SDCGRTRGRRRVGCGVDTTAWNSGGAEGEGSAAVLITGEYAVSELRSQSRKSNPHSPAPFPNFAGRCAFRSAGLCPGRTAGAAVATWFVYDSDSSRRSLRLSASNDIECIRFCRVTMPTRRWSSTTGMMLELRAVSLRNAVPSESWRTETSKILLITA